MNHPFLRPGEERRTYAVQLRIDQPEATPVMRGIAAMFNSISEDLGGFREQIAPGAFKSALAGSDVRALFNHDPSMILGRTASGTLRLTETDQGLEFECDVPDTSYARDLTESMKRRDVNQCSFGFTVANGGDTWQKDDAGQWIRTIHVVSRLYDVSPVTYPAYPETSCAMRSLEKIRAETPPAFDNSQIRRKLAFAAV
jgi:HK97 family phage prohead protease